MAYVPGLSIVVIDKTVDMNEWMDMLSLTREANGPDQRLSFVWMKGGDVSAEQRRATAADQEVHKNNNTVGLALVTDSIVMRGALTAYSWLIKQKYPTRAFSPAQLDEAWEWLGTLNAYDAKAAKEALNIILDPVRQQRRSS